MIRDNVIWFNFCFKETFSVSDHGVVTGLEASKQENIQWVFSLTNVNPFFDLATSKPKTYFKSPKSLTLNIPSSYVVISGIS